MDPLLRGRHCNHLLRRAVRLRLGARRGRGDEPNDRVDEAVRFDLQLQVVRQHVHHPLSKQKGFV